MCLPPEGQRRRRGHGEEQRGRGGSAGGADREAAGEGGVGPERAEEPVPRHLPGTRRVHVKTLRAGGAAVAKAVDPYATPELKLTNGESAESQSRRLLSAQVPPHRRDGGSRLPRLLVLSASSLY